MELYIIRHGQSVGNTVKEDMPDPPLTELGLRQAQAVKSKSYISGTTGTFIDRCDPK